MGSFDDDRWSENDDDEAEVGYRKPPRHSRFRKGQSSNSRGKLRGTKNSATLLKQALLASVLVKEDGRETKTSKLKVIVTRVVHEAMQGDYDSICLLLRYAGLDRRLNEPKHERRGLSAEAAALISRALLGESYEPEALATNELRGQKAPNQPFPGKGSRSNEKSRRRPFQVGYGKPPTHTRFEKGRSGNPFGRPRAPRRSECLPSGCSMKKFR